MSLHSSEIAVVHKVNVCQWVRSNGGKNLKLFCEAQQKTSDFLNISAIDLCGINLVIVAFEPISTFAPGTVNSV